MAVFEGEVRLVLEQRPGFEGNFAPVERQRLVAQRIPGIVRWIIAASAIIPGSEVLEVEPQEIEVLLSQTEAQPIIVGVKNAAPIEGEQGVRRDALLEMEVLNAAKGTLRQVAILFGLRRVSARD